jgi:hypothetical protein
MVLNFAGVSVGSPAVLNSQLKEIAREVALDNAYIAIFDLVVEEILALWCFLDRGREHN